MKHFSQLVGSTDKQLRGKYKSEFLKTVTLLQVENLERINDEVHWFCDKFDYRNVDKPWKNSKDSLPRMLNKLSGKIVNSRK